MAGPRSFVAKGRRIRKLFGGGMRQAGIVAAAALYALDHNIDRLAEDHKNARLIAQAISETPGLHPYPTQIDTNLVWFRVDPNRATAKDVAMTLKRAGILVHVAGPQALRACTHLDVSSAQAQRAAETIRTVLKN